MIRKIFSLLVLILSIAEAFPQNCSHCDIALLYGARDEFESKNNYRYDEATSELFKHDYSFWDNYQSFTNKSKSLNAAYSIYSASFGSSQQKGQQQQKFESFKTNYEKNKTLSQEEQKYISTKTASGAAYNAWTICIQGCGKGIFLEKEGNNNDEFIISLKWIPTDGFATTSKVTSIQYTNSDILSGDLKEQAEIKIYSSLLSTFKRKDRNKDISITINVENLGSKSITISKNDELETKQSISLPINVPSGTVVAYAGNRIPIGWLLCDGSVKNEKEYPSLFIALGTSWGSGNSSAGSFNLPDMRGMFLRGVDGEADNDPDHNSRKSNAKNGGNSGNQVGSFQADTLKKHKHLSHRHEGKPSLWNTNWPKNSQSGNVDIVAGQTGEDGGLETRPKNVYVFWIIKE